MAGKAVEVTDSNFEATILNSDEPALVDFWAVWCGPCRIVGPIVEEIADEYDGRAVVGKLDVDSAPETAARYGITSIPSVLFFAGGEEKADLRQVGVQPKKTYQTAIDSLAAE